MNEAILNLLVDYSIQGKPIDKAYIEKIVTIVKISRGLHGQLIGVKLFDTAPDENSKAAASYKPYFKSIEVYLDTFKDIVDYKRDMFSDLTNKTENLFLSNLFATQLILHELEHAYQEKKMQTRDDDEAKLLRIVHTGIQSIIDELQRVDVENATLEGIKREVEWVTEKLKLDVETYNSYYSMELGERLANIDSFNSIIRILSPIKDRVPNLVNISKIFEVANLIEGYDDSEEILSPTIIYAQVKGDQSKLRTFDWYSENFDETLLRVGKKYKLVDRLRLGLPISKEEFHYVNDYYSKMSFR